MQKKKNNFWSISYIVLSLGIIALNSIAVVTWLNKSLFSDYILNTEGVYTSFYNGVSLIILLTILVFSILGTLLTSILIIDLIFGALIIANNIKVIERNDFITFSELQTIFSPKELLSFIEIPIVSAFIVVILIVIGLIVFHWLTTKFVKRANLLIKNKLRISLLIVSFSMLVFIYVKPNLYNEYILGYDVPDYHNFNPLKRAQRAGFLPSFIHTIKPTYMEKPFQYDKLTTDKIFDEYSQMADDINEHRTKSLADSQTILYLSESLMDPARLPNLLLNETPIPFITEVTKNNIGGTMYSQYIGGGTANIEWSLLTSFSLEVFLNPMSITPYSDFYSDSKNHHTVLSMYPNSKIALHPYTAELYKRKIIYNKMGFDDFLYLNNGIKHTEKLGTHERISDESLNKDVFRFLGKEGIGLMHVLTMQNHSPYSGEIPDMSYQPKINLEVFPEEDTEGLYNYLQGLKASDDALRGLINEMEKYDTEINLVVYGDHFPNLFTGLEEQFTAQQLHETPWFIYMNQGRSSNNETQIEELSPIFLTTVLLNEGDYYVSPFQALMDNLLTKGVNRIGHDFIVTKDGKVMDDELSKDLLELVTDYRTVMYDSLFGENWLPDQFYTETGT